MKKTPMNVANQGLEAGQGASPLLVYLFPTQPSPLQASSAGGTSNAFLNVVASANGKTVYCKKITLYVPVGEGAGYLTPNKPAITPNTANWTVAASEVVKGKDTPFANEDIASTSFVAYTCNPISSAMDKIDYDLQFSINVLGVDQVVGEYPIGIVEESSEDGANYTSKNKEYTLQKSAPMFYLKNFISSASGSVANTRVPSGEFSNGEAITLSWESNGTAFKIFESGASAPIYSGADLEFALPNGLSNTKTLILQAEVTGGPGSGTTAPGFETIYLYESLAVQITNPDLNPSSVNAAGNIHSGGNLTVTGSSTTGNSQVNGTLNVTGKATMASAEVTSLLEAKGDTQLSTFTSRGHATFLNGFDVQTGMVGMMGEGTLLYQGSSGDHYEKSWQVGTDGIVVGYCEGVLTPGGLMAQWIYIVSDSRETGSLGGSLPSGLSNPAWLSSPGSISLPVVKGASFTIYSTPCPANTGGVYPDVSFWYYPFGGKVLDRNPLVELEERPAGNAIKNQPF